MKPTLHVYLNGLGCFQFKIPVTDINVSILVLLFYINFGY